MVKRFKYKFCNTCKKYGVSYSKLSKKRAIELRHPWAKGREKCRYCGETNYK